MAKKSFSELGTVHDRRATLPKSMHVAEAIVDDPYGTIPGAKVLVYRHLRNDPVAAMHAARQIGDLELMAARRWQRYYILSQVGGVKAIDTTREKVDGGKFIGPIDEKSLAAQDKINEAAAYLGKEGAGLINDVLGLELTIKVAALRRGFETKSKIEYCGARFRECLKTLVSIYGYTT